MPPKVKTSKESITEAAFQIVRERGAKAINARDIAAALGCSTQPIFSNFSSMSELKLSVIERADKLCEEYIREEAEGGEFPAYKASGMAYIRFAKEEKELFKLLYMRNRADETDYPALDLSSQMAEIVQNATGLEGENVKLFHLEMWVYVHGIASLFATGFLDLDRELVSKMITDCYQGLRKQFGLE